MKISATSFEEENDKNFRLYINLSLIESDLLLSIIVFNSSSRKISPR